MHNVLMTLSLNPLHHQCVYASCVKCHMENVLMPPLLIVLFHITINLPEVLFAKLDFVFLVEVQMEVQCVKPTVHQQ